MIKTEEMSVSGFDEEIDGVLKEAESFAKNMELSDRDSLRFRLLTEETMSVVRQITGDHVMTLKFIGEGKTCTIHLEIKTAVDSYVRENLLSVSKSGKNEAAKGVLGKIRDVVESFIAAREVDMAYPAPDRTADFMIMGMSSGIPSEVEFGMQDAYYWTLDNYRNSVEEEKNKAEGETEDWDELEKSVVANLAGDVRIGIQGDHVTVDVIRDFA
ncbi:MAG: hypothetical protein K6E33_09320 [Lachnospiraceae bacterium]|nr:hypothetical protein [Lachnospiraceae bacterium]